MTQKQYNQLFDAIYKLAMEATNTRDPRTAQAVTLTEVLSRLKELTPRPSPTPSPSPPPRHVRLLEILKGASALDPGRLFDCERAVMAREILDLFGAPRPLVWKGVEARDVPPSVDPRTY